MNIARTLLAASTLCATMAPARAVEAPLPLWEAGVLGGTAVTPAYPGASERSMRSLALPYLIYRGKVLRADRSGVGARLFNTERFDFDIGFALSLPARSSDVPARRGMPDLGTLVEFGPRLKIRLAEPTQHSRLGLELPLRAVIEARGGLRRQGTTFEPRLVYALQDGQQAWHVDASVGAVLGNATINDYLYSVSPAFATGQRPAYAAKSGLMLTRLGLGGSYRLQRDWRAFAFVRYDTYTGAANRASPLLRQNSGTSAGIGLMWTWQRSSSLARGPDD
ncbi:MULTISPECIES: MipA/OmpV family protein [Janthinobacterium]|uniref:MipA/OmpV family protein n=1 Tax=Janthinobacterium kumbetense TaxID=2950280 RepID=A0ABT0WNY5_9BURK|nr:MULTISPECIES: MipA/OmpV family protein [Janthinobacterium]MCM2565603.1 MipA/OmpV family protein [Janthinobacterium kumbetense]MDN2678773.1 MipA/OmpV family protein [Janthinobacterium sp. SUN033]